MKRYFQWITILALAIQAFGQSGNTTAGPSDSSTPAAPPVRMTPPRGQGRGGPERPFSERLQEMVQNASDSNADKNLPRFDLDFPGGIPRELVKAIEKASGKPLNAVIREEDANCRLAAISVKNVNVAQLFTALIQVSSEQQVVRTGTSRRGDFGGGGGIGQYTYHNSYYGFKTQGNPTENSIWYFVHDQVPDVPDPAPPMVCRFYQLAPYLDASYKVEDITTAIETGWKMLGEKNPPKISYHKDTKLLIAVGQPDKLEMIGQVLQSLVRPSAPNAGPTAAPPLPIAPRPPRENQ